ncbi:hypothetical protein LTR37_011597 [Vermiconidia calcicola]|uniref:Uncharacterized protein n=1 Tax=Vermiconidia calcicola TaxID=1690605 RepID=A0ACC3N1X5_9PEZI|nr:hypothetical protein LTR37_011597 [Vermiconidia calcicola]
MRSFPAIGSTEDANREDYISSTKQDSQKQQPVVVVKAVGSIHADNMAEVDALPFLKTEPQICEEIVMSGAVPNDDDESCQNNPQRPRCSNESYSLQLPKPISDTESKFLSRLFESTETTQTQKRRISFLDISAAVNEFELEVHTSFLSPTGKLVLHHFKALAKSPSKPANVLLRVLTENLPMEQKVTLVKDLGHLLRPQDRYPLQQVMLHEVEVRSNPQGHVQQTAHVEGPLSTYTVFDTEDDANRKDQKHDERALTPAPLKIRKLLKDEDREKYSLSPLADAGEPQAPSTPLEMTVLDWQSATQAATKQQGSVKHARADLIERCGHDVPNHLLQSRSSTESGRRTPQPGFTGPKVPGSVRRAHLAARQALSGSSDTSDRPSPKVASAVSSPQRSTETIRSFTPDVAKPDDSPSSHDDAFMNPRKPPQPPPRFPPREGSLPRVAPSQPRIIAEGPAAAAFREASIQKQLGGPQPSTGHFHSLGLSESARYALQTPSSRAEESSVTLIDTPNSETQFTSRSSSLPHGPWSATDHKVRGPRISRYPFFGLTHMSSGKRQPESTVLSRGQGNPRTEEPYSQGTPASNGSCLRGGGSSQSSTTKPEPSQDRRKRINTVLGHVNRLEDSERPHAGLWWLAGGRAGGGRRVPTAGELRERRKLEEANRNAVGFWGTALGVRAVRRLSVADPDGDGEDAGADAKGVEKNKDVDEGERGDDVDGGEHAAKAVGS